jgi:serine/threonine protein kinase
MTTIHYSSEPSSTSTNGSPEVLSIATGHARVPYEDLRDEEDVGQGAFGLVVKARWGELTVAIKYLYNSREMRRELDNLKRVLGGEHIVRIYGLTTGVHGLSGIVMEYYPNGTLRNYLASNFQQFTWECKFNIAQEIAKGLLFVHQQGLLHRDLHDCNILIDGGGHALIADFGLARPIIRDKTSGNRCGLTAFIPPERLREEQGQFTERGDVYSLGGILWEITAGREPFHGMSYIAVGIKVLKGKREKPINGTPEWYREIYTKCWAAEPKDRPNVNLVVLCLTRRGRHPISFHIHLVQ